MMIAPPFVEGGRVQTRLKAALEVERLDAAKIAGELSAASEIQSGMLLPRGDLRRVSPAVEIDAVLQPARSVGGDLYDAFMLDPTRLCFLVGDVTGKGVPASLFMALSKALSRSILARPGIDLAKAVDDINAELSRDNGQMMAVSLLVGLLDLDSGRLDLCSAGHENLAGAERRRRGARTVPGWRARRSAWSTAFPIRWRSTAWRRARTLVVFTDGVIEAQSPREELFDREGAMAALSPLATRPLADLIDGLVAAVRAFEAGGEPSDDLTVLALRPGRPVAGDQRSRHADCAAQSTLSAVGTSSSRSPRPAKRVIDRSRRPIDTSTSRISRARLRESASLSASEPTVSVWPMISISAPGRSVISLANIFCRSARLRVRAPAGGCPPRK